MTVLSPETMGLAGVPVSAIALWVWSKRKLFKLTFTLTFDSSGNKDE